MDKQNIDTMIALYLDNRRKTKAQSPISDILIKASYKRGHEDRLSGSHPEPYAYICNLKQSIKMLECQHHECKIAYWAGYNEFVK